MQVQGINNQTNISHKAYFKPNEKFKVLYGRNELVKKDLIENFKSLPDHELEIIASEKGSPYMQTRYTIFNNNTAKSISQWFDDRFDILSNIMNFLLQKGDAQENFFKETPLEQIGYISLTTPKIFKK